MALYSSLLIRNTIFRRYWFSQLLSDLGNNASFFILPLIALDSLRADVAHMGFLGLLGPSTKLIFGPLIGSRIDRSHSPIIIMRYSAIFRTIIILTIPLAAILHHISFLDLCLIEILVGFSGVYFSVSSSAILPHICSPSELITANSLNKLSFSFTMLMGPSCGGILVQIFGSTNAIVLDSLAFAGTALCTLGIKYRPYEVTTVSDPTSQTSIIANLSTIFRNKTQRLLMLTTITAAFSGNAYYILLIMFAMRELGLNSGSYGLAIGIGSIGAVIGSMLTPLIIRILGIGPSLIFGAISYSGVLCITTLSPQHHPLLAFFLIIITEIFSGAGMMIYEVAEARIQQYMMIYEVAEARIQQYITPIDLLGSVGGIFLAGNSGGNTLAGIVIAVIGSFLSLRLTMIICLAVGIVGGVYLLSTPLRTLRFVD